MLPTDMSERTLKRDWLYFSLLTFLFSFGFAIYNGVFQNYFRDVTHGQPFDLGRLESMREFPGLLAALTAGSLAALAEARIAGLGLMITAVGVGFTGHMPSYAALVGISVFWSVGFHLYSAVGPAITLALAKGREGGRHLGRMGAIGATATVTGLGASWLLSQILGKGHYPIYFHIAGVCIAASAVLCSLLSTHAAGAPRAAIVLRKEYGLYYLLTFLEGCRRQIFSIFATFALVTVYHVPLQHMLALQFLNSILIAMTAPRIGRIVDKKGERDPLSFYAVGLILVFVGYSSITKIGVLYFLYILDNVLFSFSVGFTTYLHRIVRKDELTPCLSMGTTMNHIAAVTVPIGGAWLWQHYQSYQIPFWVGMAIALGSFSVTRMLPAGPIPREEAAA